ncbi:PAS domain S-box protein [Aeromonas media]|uniref:PAS domain S-box protein n=1 Tax=Aeromonas media TaxID=651 RepID=A0A6M4Y9J7_AERME|nr:PAS domain S-box protein [Aeromonas media]QJT21927.1 PAS domain S-box protein [Aeromonas media]QYK82418.1 PAS domain S-box protein [Aeromonas media]
MAEQPPLTRAHVLNVVLTYAAVASLWILLSDKAVEWLFSTPAQFALASTIKGWLFILITALMLYTMLRRRINQSTASPRLSRRQWLPILLLNSLILALTAMAIAQNIGLTRDKEVARLETIADLKSRRITEWLGNREQDLRQIIDNPRYGDLSPSRQRTKPSDEQAQRLTRLVEFISAEGFDGAALFDPAGQPLWQTPGAGVMNATLRDALARVTAGKVLRVGPYLDELGQPRLDFLAPLATAAGPAPVIVLQISGSHWINQILKPWPIPDSSGEATLFRQRADQVQYLSDLRYRPDSALRLHLPLHHDTLLAAQYLRLDAGQRGPRVLSGKDYRDMAAFGVVYPVEGTDWYLLAKIDKAELNQASFKESIWIGLISLLVLFVTNAGIILLRQHTRLLMTEQVRHSQAQRLQALQLLSAIADSSEDAIFAKDREGKYILFNRAASQFVGKPAAEMLGQDDLAIFPPDQARMLMAAGRRVIENNRVQTEEEYLTLPCGDRVFLATKGPLQDNDGQVIGIFGISRDITGFKRAEADLREREGLFRALVEQSLAGIYIIQQGRLCYINPCFAHLFGYDSPGALLGVGPLHALASPEDSERVAELVLRCEQEGGDIHARFSALHHGSQALEVELYGRRVDYRGQPAVLGLLLDVTEREQVEQALTRQAMELRQQNEELERFNKVMVDRELAMLTLKHQINELSRQLGLPPPYPQAPMPPEEHP